MANETRKALHELIDFLREAETRWMGSEWMIESEADVADAGRALMHMLAGGLHGFFECDPAHPVFRRIVSPARKFSGDNADAIYYDAPVDPSHRYRVRGNMAGAVYVSLTVEEGTREGHMASRTAGVINDTAFDVGEDGSFEILLDPEAEGRNRLRLTPGASRITTRHYYERVDSAAADPRLRIPLHIERLDSAPPPPPPSDASVAAGIRRVLHFVRSRTLDQPPPGKREQPAFVGTTPNRFPPPVPPGDVGLSAFDCAYSMAPYLLGPDQALRINGRWPSCRCANVSLWNRHIQTFDYANRPVWLNRARTRLGPDGSFEMIVAHRDPGRPNWLDTEGRPFGMVFWRFMLPEGEIATPEAEVVPFAEVAGSPA